MELVYLLFSRLECSDRRLNKVKVVLGAQPSLDPTLNINNAHYLELQTHNATLSPDRLDIINSHRQAKHLTDYRLTDSDVLAHTSATKVLTIACSWQEVIFARAYIRHSPSNCPHQRRIISLNG